MYDRYVSDVSNMEATKGETTLKITKSNKCQVCGKSVDRFTRPKEDGTFICSDCEREQYNVPKPDQPLVCSFQRRFSTPYRVQCALTAIGDGGVISRAFVNYEPCKIDICPMYQNWKKGDKARLIPV